MIKLHPVILCGGIGVRLWPYSRQAMPKPFLPLAGGRTLFEQTLARCSDRSRFEPPIVVAGAAQRRHVLEQAGHIPGLRVIEEPEARNTAAAIALAAELLPAGELMLVCPSDHHIGDVAAFHTACAAGVPLAEDGWLVTFGITPSAPETGYGYMLRGEALPGGFRVSRFVEKPDADTARILSRDGRHAWNGGIFLMRAGTYLQQLEQYRPGIAAGARAAMAFGDENGLLIHPETEPFAAIAGESVDCAVMEETDRAAMVPVEMDWSDIGNWRSLHAASERDNDGNAIQGDVELLDSRNVLAQTDGPRISVIGLSDIAVVVHDGEVLVTGLKDAQRVASLKAAREQRMRR